VPVLGQYGLYTPPLLPSRSPLLIIHFPSPPSFAACSFKTEKRAVLHALPRGDRSSLTCLAQFTGGERELLTGTSDGRLLVWDAAVPDASVGEVDVAGLWRSCSGGTGDAAKAGSFHILAVRVSPSARFVAVLASGGRFAVLQVPPASGALAGAQARVGGGGGRASIAAAAGPTPVPARKSILGDLRIAATLTAHAPYVDFVWSQDEARLLASASDGSLGVLSWCA
jgi:hypothetical protein